MAYIYCDSCEEGLDKPSVREIVTLNYCCPHCGSNNSDRLSDDDVRDAMDNILDRLEALEAKQ